METDTFKWFADKNYLSVKFDRFDDKYLRKNTLGSSYPITSSIILDYTTKTVGISKFFDNQVTIFVNYIKNNFERIFSKHDFHLFWMNRNGDIVEKDYFDRILFNSLEDKILAITSEHFNEFFKYAINRWDATQLLKELDELGCFMSDDDYIKIFTKEFVKISPLNTGIPSEYLDSVNSNLRKLFSTFGAELSIKGLINIFENCLSQDLHSKIEELLPLLNFFDEYQATENLKILLVEIANNPKSNVVVVDLVIRMLEIWPNDYTIQCLKKLTTTVPFLVEYKQQGLDDLYR